MTTPVATSHPAQVRTPSPAPSAEGPRPPRRPLDVRWGAAAGLLAVAAAAVGLFTVDLDVGDAPLTSSGRTALIVFLVAVWAWAGTSVDDTYIALGAGTALVILGAIETDGLFQALGDDVVWLLVGAAVIASAVARSGLAHRAGMWLLTGACSPRAVVHIVTLALVVTAFVVPATSGRAALALPVFLAVRAALRETGLSMDWLVKVLALTFPTVILLSAVGSLIGAGAHLVTSMLVEQATGSGFNFATWLILGLPLALVSSHTAAELVLALFSSRDQRRTRFVLPIQSPGPLSSAEGRALALLVAVVVLWSTQSLHGVDPAVVALLGALLITLPAFGIATFKEGLSAVPWSMLLFMAATIAMGDALLGTGAAQFLAARTFAAIGTESVLGFMILVVAVSAAAHLVIQSRSARSAVLVPIVISLAPPLGVSAAAAAFASTAAAGFCHTLTSSAKPVAMFASVDGVATYAPEDLRRLSIWLGPLTVVLVLAFSFWIWPQLGLPLYQPS